MLAAGFGTRLRPLTLERSKAAVPVGGLPAAAWALDGLARAGIRDVAVNLHHLPGSVTEALEPVMGDQMAVTWSPEQPRILGTGGGIRRAARLLGATHMVVANGDVVCDLDFAGLIAHHDGSGADATLALVAHPQHASYGTVLLGPDGTILSIAGTRSRAAPLSPEPCERPTVFSGIHVLGPAALERLPDSGCVVRDTYFGMLRDGIRLGGYLHPGYWNDIGTPAKYLACNLDILHGRAGGLRPAWTADGPRMVHPRASVHPDARTGEDVIVGAGAYLGPAARLRRCVVWDGARVDGRHDGCVISRQHVVQVQG